MTRIQRKREKGWKSPENTKYCGRTGKYGNPFKVGEYGDAAYCVALFRSYLRVKMSAEPRFLDGLKGYQRLPCFCPLDAPCHLDVIIEALTTGLQPYKRMEFDDLPLFRMAV